MNRNRPESVRQRVLVSVDVPRGRSLETPRRSPTCVCVCVCVCVYTSVCLVHIDILLSLFLQFDEEFSARQEAQAESQKKEERIKELEGKIQALESQVNL